MTAAYNPLAGCRLERLRPAEAPPYRGIDFSERLALMRREIARQLGDNGGLYWNLAEPGTVHVEGVLDLNEILKAIGHG